MSRLPSSSPHFNLYSLKILLLSPSLSVDFFHFLPGCKPADLGGEVLTLAPAARPWVQIVWVEPVGSVHFG